MTPLDPAVAARVRWDRDGLVPAVVQDAVSRAVLMVGWMDDAALRATLTTGRATFFSRSRQELWVKGETSGNRQWVQEVRLDCDGDTLLVLVDTDGPACHTGAETCFDDGVLESVQVAADQRPVHRVGKADGARGGGSTGHSGGGREYLAVLAVGAVAVALVLLALGRPWVTAEVVTDGMPRQAVAVSGNEATDWLRAVTMVALAALAATVATTGRWRRLLGAGVALAAAAVAAGAATARGALEGTVAESARETAAGADAEAVAAAVAAASHNGWPWVTVLAAGLLAAVGLVVVARGPVWPGMSRRYERSASGGGAEPQAAPEQHADAAQRTDAQDLWLALDEGRDPTR